MLCVLALVRYNREYIFEDIMLLNMFWSGTRFSIVLIRPGNHRCGPCGTNFLRTPLCSTKIVRTCSEILCWFDQSQPLKPLTCLCIYQVDFLICFSTELKKMEGLNFDVILRHCWYITWYYTQERVDGTMLKLINFIPVLTPCLCRLLLKK